MAVSPSRDAANRHAIALVRLFILSLLLHFNPCPAEDKIQVDVLLSTSNKNRIKETFHRTLFNSLEAVADDLNIELSIGYGKSSSVVAKRAGVELLKSNNPDYFLCGYFKDVTDHHLEYTANTRTKLFVFNAVPSRQDKQKVGEPREKYAHWIGQLNMDDRKTGFLLADRLIEMAKKANLLNKQGKVEIIALGGNYDDFISSERIEGLKDRVKMQNDAVLNQSVLAGWSHTNAETSTTSLLDRHPNTRVIWSASDKMVAGAIRAIENKGWKPGVDVLLGGINLDDEALERIEHGTQAVSIGGNALAAAWSLIMLYDYHHGIDFTENNGYKFEIEPYAVTKLNLKSYNKTFPIPDWNKINFRQFSKKHYPGISKYEFSLDAFRKTLEKKQSWQQ